MTSSVSLSESELAKVPAWDPVVGTLLFAAALMLLLLLVLLLLWANSIVLTFSVSLSESELANVGPDSGNLVVCYCSEAVVAGLSIIEVG